MQTLDENLELNRHIMATAEVLGRVLSSTAARLIAEDLEKYPFLDCINALKVCRAEVRGALTLSEIVTRINAADGRPSRNEAWAIALQSMDDRDTVVWTREITLALEAARPVLAARDKVAARMTFLDAYDRLMASARESGAPAQWSASIGWDGSMRAHALEQAVKLQRLSTPQAVAMLQHAGHGSAECADLAQRLLPKGEADALQLGGPLTADGQAIAQLLIGQDSKAVAPSPEVRDQLQKLRESMVNNAKQREQRRLEEYEATRRDLEERKRRIDEQVARYGITADPGFQAEQAVRQMKAEAAKSIGSKRI